MKDEGLLFETRNAKPGTQNSELRTQNSLLDQAREVLRVEAEAILRLGDKLDSGFEQAVELLLQCRGRVIVSGMGKSGIVGRKISATLASTGTPSLSMHPAEAVHGDLGMVTRDDVVIAISNSGETEEILRLLPTLKKIGARLVAFTGNRDSTLAKHSDCVVDVGVSEEACPLGLAPTASTTAALAMGDALAMVVSQKRGFCAEDYGLFHPAGVIGKSLMRVRDVMRTDNRCPVVKEETRLCDALCKISDARAGAATVVNGNGAVVGIFTDGDLRRAVAKDPNVLHRPIGDVMKRNPITISPDALAMEAARVARERQVTELPVVDEAHMPIGVFNTKDVL